MRIVLVEDNAAVLEYMEMVLQMEGHTVATYQSGTALLQGYASEGKTSAMLPYDLLIVDLWLPGGVSGLDIIIFLRQSFSSEQLPILLISGASPQELEPIKSQFPDLPILRKPFKIGALLDAIEQVKPVERDSEQEVGDHS